MELFNNNYYLHVAFSIALMISSSYWIFKSLRATGNYWVESAFLIQSIFLLPQISYVITKVISGNIALSLGMVGALSIVRFRHPVKNPLELVMYFGLIALGIAFSVNIKWGIMLGFMFGFCLLIIYRLLIKNNENKLDVKEIFEITVYAEELIHTLQSSLDLRYFEFKKNNTEYIYKLEYKNRKLLNDAIVDINGLNVKQIVINA